MPLVLHPDSVCDICLEPFCDTLTPHAIPCGHIFCEPCFTDAHLRQHLCGICREPYRPERIKRIHVDMKYANAPESLGNLDEEVEDHANDGSLRRTKLPADYALLFKLAVALDLRSEAPVKRLKTALKQATRWKNANADSPSGLGLKNLLRFVDDYRFATDQCRQYEAELQRLRQVNNVLSWPESTDTNSVSAMRQELKETQKQLRDLSNEMAQLKTMSPMTFTPVEPSTTLFEHKPSHSPQGFPLPPIENFSRQESALDSQRRFLQGYIDGAHEMRTVLSALSSPSPSVDSHTLEASDFGLATPSSLGSGSPLQSLRGDLDQWENSPPYTSPSLTPMGLGDVSRNSSRRSRRSEPRPDTRNEPSTLRSPPRAPRIGSNLSLPSRPNTRNDSSVTRSPPQAPRMRPNRTLPSNTSSEQLNDVDRLLTETSTLFRPSRNQSVRSAVSVRTELSWGTSTSGNTLNRLPLGQLPAFSSGRSAGEDNTSRLLL